MHKSPVNEIISTVNVLKKILFMFASKIWNFRDGIHNMFGRIAKREDPDQTASSEAVWSGSALFV